MNKKAYKEYVKNKERPSPVLKNCIFAFLIGGGICTLGQSFRHLYTNLTSDERLGSSLTCITLIFIAILFTGLGVFDKVAKIAGAGTLVPITGFANAVASCAIDSKSEGYVMGVGAKIFTIAGPVILYGIATGAIYGVIYYIAGLIA